jgi:hypothetical protein
MACAIAATTAWTPIAGFSTRQNVSAQEPPKLNLAGELQALGGLDSGLAGDLGLGEGETVTLTATLKAVNGGPAGVLEVEAKIAADWHLYSLTQPPGGPLRTKLELLATPPLELTGAWKAAQPPKIRRVPEYPGVDLEEHSDKILWTAPVKLPAGVDPDKYGLRLKLSGLTCRDNDSCLPVKLTTAVKLVGFLPSTREAETAPAANPAASAFRRQAGTVSGDVVAWRNQRPCDVHRCSARRHSFLGADGQAATGLAFLHLGGHRPRGWLALQAYRAGDRSAAGMDAVRRGRQQTDSLKARAGKSTGGVFRG